MAHWHMGLSFRKVSGGVDFTDGQTVASGTFNSTNAGEPAPFNAFNGADPSGPNFSASWTFSYGAIVGTVSSATLQIGLLDGDSAASGNQVASYTIGGIDITALLNTVMEATPGANSKENYYQITLPASTFSLLALGGPTVSLTLQGPGLGVLGETNFNGAALDFSTITINSSDAVGATPLPATLPLFATGLGASGLFGWRRKKKAAALAARSRHQIEFGETAALAVFLFANAENTSAAARRRARRWPAVGWLAAQPAARPSAAPSAPPTSGPRSRSPR